MREFVEDEIGRFGRRSATVRSDQALVHSSAVTAKIINDKNPGAGMQIQGVIDVLDAQNQAALKVMPAVIGKSGRRSGGQHRGASVRARRDSLNRAIGEHLQHRR
jgi:hypothetical protein